MDPDSAWKSLADAFQNDDSERCSELAAALVGWLKNGGYPPAISRHQAFDRHVVRSACESLLAREAA